MNSVQDNTVPWRCMNIVIHILYLSYLCKVCTIVILGFRFLSIGNPEKIRPNSLNLFLRIIFGFTFEHGITNKVPVFMLFLASSLLSLIRHKWNEITVVWGRCYGKENSRMLIFVPADVRTLLMSSNPLKLGRLMGKYSFTTIHCQCIIAFSIIFYW